MAKTTSEAIDSVVDIELSKALDVDGVKVTKLRMREPTVADQLASEEMAGGEAVKEIAMLANLCEISPADIKQLTLRDYKKVQAAFLGFIG